MFRNLYNLYINLLANEKTILSIYSYYVIQNNIFNTSKVYDDIFSVES